MLDSFSIKVIRWPLAQSAKLINKLGITANQTTLFGFVLGCLAFPALIAEQYLLALVFIVLNRICDGLDGALARIQGITDAGGFLDISLDFLFYSLIPFGFVLANPDQNAIAGAFLIFSFVGTGSSFLAFAIMASKQGIDNPVYKHKSLYYMSGLTEGTETIACFIAFCLFPTHFAIIAYVFGAACWFTTFTRIYSGFHTLKP
ncbi:CDP-alcohol phosphatidyltransferase family protein [Aliivibrio fischeri]|uniref:CDP-diacylglycerol--glycerol-3-phosphate 3-phosphatidyltransferase n=1 Tax=Aliivibrio fischeri SR5 TaxID=1088719 RepID=A0AAV3EQ04_ALIFS|nr:MULTISPECIES: CDP-alcohol phosphatidyltransferase family protein [Aliivibrio]EHN68813.1 CDP-diacylglycerol--glycerol-3-phosphate 3-phosphatidyltransferase [Aliivibrio fischeri SR5]MBD1569946.1 CDP-alcohol phosphatidyltransferase family protein [Aliivibrio sp. S10_S31]MBP3139544.1 CDP-alcohol phosphatidyltransferase family protein [Aliivibrio fischeri]MBP3155134.1 CDP-alcohol phosphatidyltransferase family protein [Aliivibrio fischeri]MCE7535986.1 CDP-alcohol phosphatidyltransferase family p